MLSFDKIRKITQENLVCSVPDYEDGKSPLEMLENQTAFLEKTNSEIRNLAESAKTIANSSKMQADIAVRTSKKADIKGWVSVFLSAFCAFMEFAVHHTEIFEFIKTISAK